MDSQRVVIAGCGFLGEAAAFLFAESGSRVLGICATEESVAKLSLRPFEARAADLTAPLSGIPDLWRNPDILIHCASSGKGGADSYRSVYRDGLANLLEFFEPRRVIFTSSTSVYAQEHGEWVDENSPAEPARETGRILLEAEHLATDAGGIVARLAGIYGPGRSVLLRKFQEGSAVLEAEGTRWINQIHRDDAARALVALANPSVSSGIFNVCDDTPATQRDVYGWIADYLHKPLPPEGPPDLNRKRGWTSKRISNAKLKTTGWLPLFPSYRSALPGLTN
ncbi:MAG: SDR family oxidoreductase [Terrimicrobiaceae bacterium]